MAQGAEKLSPGRDLALIKELLVRSADVQSGCGPGTPACLLPPNPSAGAIAVRVGDLPHRVHWEQPGGISVP